MFSFWFIGFIGIIAARTFYAGMKSNSLFYRAPRRYEDNENGRVFDDNLAFGYVMWTFTAAITWPLSLPIVGVYKLGQRFNRA